MCARVHFQETRDVCTCFQYVFSEQCKRAEPATRESKIWERESKKQRNMQYERPNKRTNKQRRRASPPRNYHLAFSRLTYIPHSSLSTLQSLPLFLSPSPLSCTMAMELLRVRNVTEAALLVGPLIGGFASAYHTSHEIRGSWFRSMKKPWFQPPDVVRGYKKEGTQYTKAQCQSKSRTL